MSGYVDLRRYGSRSQYARAAVQRLGSLASVVEATIEDESPQWQARERRALAAYMAARSPRPVPRCRAARAPRRAVRVARVTRVDSDDGPPEPPRSRALACWGAQ